MMKKSLPGEKVAVLAANGFCEADMTGAQRLLQDAGASLRIISPEQGLVCGWAGEGWGHHFAVDSMLKSALAADFAMLIIPGGQRSADKLRLTAHTRRFVSGFIAAEKPVVAFDEAILTLAFSIDLAGRRLCVPEQLRLGLGAPGAAFDNAPFCIDGCLMTASAQMGDRDVLFPAMLEFLVNSKAASATALQTGRAA